MAEEIMIETIRCFPCLWIYESRSLVVMDSERKYWDQLTVDYMIEESDDEGSDELIVHGLPWWSTSMKSIFLSCLFLTLV